MTVSAKAATGPQGDADFARMTNPLKTQSDFVVPTTKSFLDNRLEQENKHLRTMIEKLSYKLKLKNEGVDDDDIKVPSSGDWPSSD